MYKLYPIMGLLLVLSVMLLNLDAALLGTDHNALLPCLTVLFALATSVVWLRQRHLDAVSLSSARSGRPGNLLVMAADEEHPQGADGTAPGLEESGTETEPAADEESSAGSEAETDESDDTQSGDESAVSEAEAMDSTPKSAVAERSQHSQETAEEKIPDAAELKRLKNERVRRNLRILGICVAIYYFISAGVSWYEEKYQTPATEQASAQVPGVTAPQLLTALGTLLGQNPETSVDGDETLVISPAEATGIRYRTSAPDVISSLTVEREDSAEGLEFVLRVAAVLEGDEQIKSCLTQQDTPAKLRCLGQKFDFTLSRVSDENGAAHLELSALPR
ncbi:MAG: hypothetical protein IJ228_03985 [Succinivibrio sp.]|nr:hypothetical protein [Succinivibrio sp.]